MANLCEYDMKVIGEEKNIKKLERIMNYKESVHMYRIFQLICMSLKKRMKNYIRLAFVEIVHGAYLFA